MNKMWAKIISKLILYNSGKVILICAKSIKALRFQPYKITH